MVSGLRHQEKLWGTGNLVPRVLWLFGQQMGASRDSGVLEFCYRKVSAVKQCKSLQSSQSKNLNFFEFPRLSTGAHSLTKKARGLWVRDWGTGILLPQDFCGKTMQVVTEQPIEQFKCFRILQSLSWRPPADQRARGLWVRDCVNVGQGYQTRTRIWCGFPICRIWMFTRETNANATTSQGKRNFRKWKIFRSSCVSACAEGVKYNFKKIWCTARCAFWPFV